MRNSLALPASYLQRQANVFANQGHWKKAEEVQRMIAANDAAKRNGQEICPPACPVPPVDFSDDCGICGSSWGTCDCALDCGCD